MPKNVIEYPFGGLFTQSGSPGAFASNNGFSNVKSFGDEAPFGNFLHSIWNDFTGATAQRNLAEDERMWQEYFYNQYQSPVALVEQYRQAGLNPNMLNGSAGSATPPAASTPSVTPPMDAISSVVGMVQQKKLNDSNVEVNKSVANLNNANAAEVSANAEALRRLQNSQRVKNYADAGFTDLQAQGLAIDNKYREENAKSDLLAKQLRIPQMIADYASTLSEIDLQKQDLKNKREQLLLTKSQRALVDVQTDIAEIDKELRDLDKRERTFEVDFAESNGFSYNSSTDILLLGAIKSGDLEFANKICKSVYDMSYSQSQGSAVGAFESKLHEPQSVWNLPDAIWQRIRNGILNAATKPEYQNLNDVDTLRSVRKEILEDVPSEYQDKFNSAISDYDIQQILNEYTTSGTK